MVASPSMMATELSEPLNRLAYHVCVLREAGVIEFDSTRMGCSTLERLYRSRLRPEVERAGQIERRRFDRKAALIMKGNTR